MFACIHGPPSELPQIAGAFAPAFEQTTADTIVFDIDGLTRLFGSPRQIAQAIARHAGKNVSVAIADTVDAAILAARNCPGISVAPDMSQLPAGRLPMSNEMFEVLESWGIDTLGDLAQLPETGIAERFGAQGIYLQRLACGAVSRPLKIDQPEITYADRIELDHPVSLLEPLLFLIARILNEQCEKLQSHAMATNEIHLTLELEDKTGHHRTLRLPIAMRQSKPLLKLLQLDLEAHPPQAATTALSLVLKPVPPRTIQHGIFLPVTPAPDKLELTLARIRGLVGEQNAGTPELLDTHHPHPFLLTQKFPAVTPTTYHPPLTTHQAFRYFRPPITATVELQHARPVRIASSGVSGKISVAAGPWRTSGNWWTSVPWHRDEWDIALLNGTLYRIYREPAAGWFIEGAYD
jgi:protein ImuB